MRVNKILNLIILLLIILLLIVFILYNIYTLYKYLFKDSIDNFIDKSKVTIYFPPDNRKQKWNGDIIRTGGCGVSGSENTLILVGEGLSKNGYTVDFVSENVLKGLNRGINYTDTIDYVNTEILITVEWNQYNFSKFTNLKKIIINMASVNRNPGNIYINLRNDNPNANLIYVYPSDWAYRASNHYAGYDLNGYVINNPLMNDMLVPISNKNDTSFSWHAAWERGGEVAKKIFDKFNKNGNFYKLNYVDPNESNDKSAVISNLNKSKYFVYPLVLPDGRVHKDTFACCVAEALAMGVKVITWPIAALPELYDGGGIYFVDYPNDANVSNLTNYEFISDDSLKSDEAIDLFVNKLNEIEANNEIFDSDYYRNKFNPDTITEQWINVIQS